MILKAGFLTASLRFLSTGFGFHRPERGSQLIWGDNGAHAFNETSLSSSILAIGEEELVSASFLPPRPSQGIPLKCHD